ncbi:hypothetical protein SDJN02_13005, partial [Cucurbita argyrosperma subsp. argyrosperma]
MANKKHPHQQLTYGTRTVIEIEILRDENRRAVFVALALALALALAVTEVEAATVAAVDNGDDGGGDDLLLWNNRES